METPWTPGPWHPSPVLAAGAGHYTIRNEASRPVARIEPAGGTTQPAANARLIAAAPEMAELLEEGLVPLEEGLTFAEYAAEAGIHRARVESLLARIRNVPAPASPSLTDGERGSGP